MSNPTNNLSERVPSTILGTILITTLAIFCFSGVMVAQTTGTIHGRVLDPAGASVPSASVEVNNVGTGLVQTATTNQEGLYLVPSLPVGSYEVSVSAQGFRGFVQSGITLQVAQNARVDITLELGEVVETVEVNAEAISVDTQGTTVGATMDNARVQNLPLNGRNVLQLATLLPGVGRAVLPLQNFSGRGGAMFSVSGSRENENEVLLDGASFTGGMWNRSQNLPSPDTMQEFRVLTNTYSAEYGRSSGGIFLAITKSGTNEFHGSAWEFFRNDKLNARNFFATGKPILRQNQFGAKLGGPIIRNKTFFFGSYQGLRIRKQSVLTSFPLTAAERQGDFSSSSKAVLDPETGMPFEGNQILSSRFDPLAVNYMNEYLLLPNQPDGRLIELRSRPTDSDQITIKGDHEFNPGHRVSFRWYRNKDENRASGGQNSPVLVGTASNTVNSYTASSTHVFNPNFLGDFRFSYTTVNSAGFPGPGEKTPRELGGNFNQDGPIAVAPSTAVSGRFGVSGQFPYERPDRTVQFGGKLSWIRGNHNIKAGAEVYARKGVEIAQFAGSGRFTFNGLFSGHAAADYLIGRPSNFFLQTTITDQALSNNYHAFVQDDYKVTPRLTLNLGLRYELHTPWVQEQDFHASIRPDAPCFTDCQQSQRFPDAPPGLVYPGDAGVPRGLAPTDKNNWAPRIGLAWDPFGNGRTSIRAAYGVSYVYIGYNMTATVNQSPPFLLPISIPSPPSFSDPWRGRTDPNPYDGKTFTFPIQLYSISPDFRDGYVQQWNFNIQQQMGRSWFVQAGYVGRAAHKLSFTREVNAAVYGPGATAGNRQQRRPFFPEFYSAVSHIGAESNSNYHSLQVLVEKEFASGYTLQMAYTLAKSIDDRSRSVPGQTGPQDPSNFLNGERALSDFDQRQIFSLNGIWDLPVLKGRGGFVSTVFGGWRLSGLLRLDSGFPFLVRSGRDNALVGAGRNMGPQRPDVVGEWKLPDGRSRGEVIAEYFNTDAFIPNAGPGKEGQFGNAGRNIIIGPGNIGTDLAIQKRFPLPKERLGQIEFRGEFFNLLNRPNLNNPSPNLVSPAFGRITRAGEARVVQLGLRWDF